MASNPGAPAPAAKVKYDVKTGQNGFQHLKMTGVWERPGIYSVTGSDKAQKQFGIPLIPEKDRNAINQGILHTNKVLASTPMVLPSMTMAPHNF